MSLQLTKITDFVKTYRLRLALIVAIVGALLLLNKLLLDAPLRWHPQDYYKFQQYGNQYLDGKKHGLYPLPTLMWLFGPLAKAPEWFVYIWIIIPFAGCLYLFRIKGAALWLSIPMLTNGALGQFDGWFILPIYWLFNNHPILAGPSAALLTFKPQLAVFILPYMLFEWLRTKNRRALLSFAATFLFLYVPSFIINPRWPAQSLDIMLWRGNQPLLESRGATLWAWWWREGVTRVLLPFVIILAVYLFLRAYRRYRPQAVFLAGLLATPLFFPVSFTTAIAALPNTLPAVLLYTLSSWIAFAIDNLVGGWGGAYALVPLFVLLLLGRQEQESSSAVVPSVPRPQQLLN